MKKFLLVTLMMFLGLSFSMAQGKADIKFDKITYNFGTFSENNPIQKVTFTFTNIGNAPLVINQVRKEASSARTERFY